MGCARKRGAESITSKQGAAVKPTAVCRGGGDQQGAIFRAGKDTRMEREDCSMLLLSLGIKVGRLLRRGHGGE